MSAPKDKGDRSGVVGFHVIGSPAPQGSKRHVGGGVLIESSKKVAPWRQDVAAAALAVRPQEPLDGPLWAHMVFTLPKPKSAPKSRVAPDRTPDLSKLLRSTEDALTTAGVWADDARVVEYMRAAKVWWGHGTCALPLPGALIVVGTWDTLPAYRIHVGRARDNALRALRVAS